MSSGDGDYVPLVTIDRSVLQAKIAEVAAESAAIDGKFTVVITLIIRKGTKDGKTELGTRPCCGFHIG